DGVIVSAEEMSKIDPNEIHSVAVYKDFEKVPAGLNLSEEEAKNGVIVITTKKGASEAAGLQQRRPMSSEQQQAMHRLADSARAKGHTPQELKGRMANVKEILRANADLKITYESMPKKSDPKILYEQAMREIESAKADIEQAKQDVEQAKRDIAAAEKAAAEIATSNGVTPAVAEFAGGDYRQFRAWVQERLRYPKGAKADGEVFVTFVVKANGEVGDVDVIGEADKALAKEVVRVVKSSPTWKPATKQGKAVDAKYGIEFAFAKNVQPAETDK
ncbi:MAG: energy transducer TonB, partial [Rikenellaceae bacterium]|nr:energy transducer TonB [Rikenellaceae bacterium]